jgi:hypothetical protein
VAVRTLAARLGDAAIAKQRFSLAADYYDVAGQDPKADAARERMQQLAMNRVAQQQLAAKQLNAKKTDDLSKELGI